MGKDHVVGLTGVSTNLTCYGFHVWAGDFLAAANAYAPIAREGSLVAHFLCCQSIELSLKGFLSFKGSDRNQLKKVGHNLDKLLAAAIGRGLYKMVAQGLDDQRTLRVATDWYDSSRGKRLQYFGLADALKGFRDVPDVSSLREIAVRLQSEVLRGAFLDA